MRGHRRGREVRGEIVEHRIALAGFDDGAPAHHLVDRSSPSHARQPLLDDDIGVVTGQAPRGDGLAPRARRQLLRGRSDRRRARRSASDRERAAHGYFTSMRTASGRIPEIAGRIPRRLHRLRAAVRIRRARHDQIRLGLGRVERVLEAPPRVPRALAGQPRRLPAWRRDRSRRRRARCRSHPPTRTRRRRSCPPRAVAPSSGRVISDFTTRPVSGAMSFGSTAAPGATRLVGIAIAGGHPEAVELAIERRAGWSAT